MKKWGLALFVFLSAATSWGLTLSDLLVQTRIYLRDTQTSTSRRYFTDAQLTSFLNNGYRELNARTWANLVSSFSALSANTTYYALPSDCVAVVRVTLDNVPLTERTYSFFDDGRSNWLNSAGTPTQYFVRVDSSTTERMNRNTIGLVPVTTGTATLGVTYVGNVSDLAVSGDVPFSSDPRFLPYHQSLAFYAAYLGYLSRGMFSEALAFYQEYVAVSDGLMANSMTPKFYDPNIRAAGLRGPPAQAQQKQ